MFQHNCLKCKAQYQDEDEDPYYCDTCKTEKMKLAEQIDKNHIPRPKMKTPLEEYEEAPKGGPMNFPIYRP